MTTRPYKVYYLLVVIKLVRKFSYHMQEVFTCDNFKVLDYFHTRAKCAILMIIQIVQFALCSVHTREVIAIFELRSVHTRDRIWGLAFQSGRRCLGTLPIKHARSSHFLCVCTCLYAARGKIGGSG